MGGLTDKLQAQHTFPGVQGGNALPMVDMSLIPCTTVKRHDVCRVWLRRYKSE